MRQLSLILTLVAMLTASARVCCCSFPSEEKRQTSTCCQGEPTDSNLPSPCPCEDCDSPIFAKSATETAIPKTADFEKAGIQVAASNFGFDTQLPVGAALISPAPHVDVPALSAREHCAVLSVFLV